jgi:hypothetical protein
MLPWGSNLELGGCLPIGFVRDRDPALEIFPTINPLFCLPKGLIRRGSAVLFMRTWSLGGRDLRIAGT